MEKISISLKTRVRLPGHPQTFFNELPARGSRKGQVDPAIYATTSTAKQKRETKDGVAIFGSSPRKRAIMNLKSWSITTLNLDKEVSYLS